MNTQAFGLFVHTSFDHQRPAEMLNGYAFTATAMVFQTAGLKKYQQAHGRLCDAVTFGRFSLIEHVGQRTYIRSDPSGQDALFVYKYGEIWGVSNSLLLLSETLKQHGVRVELYQPSLDAFFVGGGGIVGGQIVSHETPIQHCKLLPMTQMVVLNHNDTQTSLTIIAVNACTEPSNYQEFLMTFGGQWRQRIRALSQLQRAISISLSGGVDSRVSKSLLQSSDVEYRCYSHAHVPRDLQIAQQLCAVTGAPLTSRRQELEDVPSRDRMRLSTADSIRLGLYSNAGVYNRFAPVQGFNFWRRINFVGGSLIGPVSMRLSVKERLTMLQQEGERGEFVANEIIHALMDLDVALDDPFAMFYHYAHFRSRLHYGCAWRTAIQSIEIHPCMDPLLLQLPRVVDREYLMANGVPHDLIQMLTPQLSAIPYDDPNKVSARRWLSEYPEVGEVDDLNCYFDLEAIEPSRHELEQLFSLADAKPATVKQHLSQLFPRLHSFASDIGFEHDMVVRAEQELTSSKRLMAFGSIMNTYVLHFGVESVLSDIQ